MDAGELDLAVLCAQAQILVVQQRLRAERRDRRRRV